MNYKTAIFPEQTETDVKRQIVEYLRLAGCRVFRLQSGRTQQNFHGNRKGTLDILTVTPSGAIWWIEVKKPSGRLSLEQENEITDLRQRGQNVTVIDNVEDVKTIF